MRHFNKYIFGKGQPASDYPEINAALSINNDKTCLEEVVVTDSRPLSITSEQLAGMIEDRSHSQLQLRGGASGIAKSLRISINLGVATDRRHDLREMYGENRLPKAKSPSLWKLLLEAFLDKILLMLTAAALISLTIGIYQDHLHGTATHWIEGAAILVAVIIVVLVNALNDWQRDRQFRALAARSEDRLVTVLQDGRATRISIFDLVVGDVCLLEPGEVVPADGIFLDGHNVQCDESGATGEAEAVKKDGEADPFLLSGTKVIDGTCSMLVVAVGEASFHGRLMMALREEPSVTPLQVKLDRLAEGIAKLGVAIALMMFLTLTLKTIITLALKSGPPPAFADILEMFLGIIIETITVVVVAVPEGLPMAVTLALAYATTRMLRDNNLVRVLAACETMGNATCICSDKTGTLTENKMTVVQGILADQPFTRSQQAGDLANVSGDVRDMVAEAISVNSTAFESIDAVTNRRSIVGNKTETALLELVKSLGFDFEQLRATATILDVFPFASVRKSMTTTIRKIASNGKNIVRIHTKGASEIVLDRCDQWMRFDGSIHEISHEDLRDLKRLINEMAERSLRTIAIAFKDVPEPVENSLMEGVTTGMTLIAMVGIEDPLRPGVEQAVAACQRAGIFVRMVTGDNMVTAQSIARQCGILMRGGLVMEGPRFRSLSDAQLREVLPRLQVLARSSPMDKQILVRTLKSMGEVVAVTGDGSNDGPALKSANVGFAMGIAGTEVAKEASSIVLLDDNFASIVKAVAWGRCVNDSVRKFLQFQLTVNVSAVVTAFVTAVVDPQSKSILSTVQLLWVNLIMDTFAALALATDRPSDDILNRRPESAESSLLTVRMIKMILGQAAYQVTALMLLIHIGPSMISALSTAVNITETGGDATVIGTVVFNSFVFMQLFNEINCRVLDDHLNPFKGILRNWIFPTVWLVTVAVQVILVFFGGLAFSTVPIDWPLWLLSIGVGFLSLPVATIIRLLPSWHWGSQAEERQPMTRERLHWQAAFHDVRRSLAFYSALRRAHRPPSIMISGSPSQQSSQ